jgi:Ser/Thr protein kinase RdoA (MazF antagonist)
LPAATADLGQQAFLEGFGFAHVARRGCLEGGMFSRPELIEADGSRFVLRLHTIRNVPASFAWQAEVVARVAAQGIGCPRVIRRGDGSWCAPTDDGQAVLALHEYAEGRTYDWAAWQIRKQQPGWLRRLGREVAALHNALAQLAATDQGEAPAELPAMQFARFEAVRAHWQRSVARCAALPGEAARALAAHARRLDAFWDRVALCCVPYAGRLRRQIVHGDVSPVNLVFRTDDRPTFIDWDAAHVGCRMYDALGDVLNRPPLEDASANEFRPDHVAEYLAGYGDALDDPPTADELALVPAFCLARQLEDFRQRAQTLHHLPIERDREYAELMHRRVAMMEQIVRCESELAALLSERR